MKKVNGKTSSSKCAVRFCFENELLGCRCVDGKCPNYCRVHCGVGGRAVFSQFSIYAKRERIKKMITEDKAFRLPVKRV